MVFQHFHLFPHMTALDNVTIGPVRVKGEDKAVATKRAKELLGQVGLADKVDAYPGSFPAASSNEWRSLEPWACSRN